MSWPQAVSNIATAFAVVGITWAIVWLLVVLWRGE